MAIAPNTTFVSGAILTAAQQNAFGFGIVATATSSAVTLTGTVEAVSITASTFTAIANRYYKITYTEGQIYLSGAYQNPGSARIRLTNAAGTLKGLSSFYNSSTITVGAVVTCITTLPAGATVIVGTLGVAQTPGASTWNAYRTELPAQIWVEDIGPA